MDKALKHQVINFMEDTCISELYNKYTGFIGLKATDLIHHPMVRYKKVTETGLK